MKYRIITNGILYRIQYRFLFFYLDVIENEPVIIAGNFCGMIKEKVEFPTLEQAKEWIENEKQEKKTWEVVQ